MLRKFVIDRKIFVLFPQARVCGLVIEDLDNSIAWDGREMLGQACREAAIRLAEVPFGESPFLYREEMHSASSGRQRVIALPWRPLQNGL